MGAVVSIVTITAKLEFAFVPDSWVDVTAYLDSESRLRWRRGTGENRLPQTSTMSFSLDNSSEAWTPANTSGAFFGKLRKGVEVRLSSFVGATQRFHWRGVITDFQPVFPAYGPANVRVEISCEGKVSELASYENYNLPLQEGKTVTAALTAIMAAVGTALYSFDTSGYIVPYVYSRGDALADAVAVAASEMGGLAFEDSLGRLRLATAENMTGGFSSPSHTWGSTIAPEGEVAPDYRANSQFARVALSLARLTPSEQTVELYRHSDVVGAPEKLMAGASRRIKGRFKQAPHVVEQTFTTAAVINFLSAEASLYAAMLVGATQLTASTVAANPTLFAKNMQIRIDNEVMIITAVTKVASNRQLLTVTRAANGTPAASHLANKTIFYRPSIQADQGLGSVPIYHSASITALILPAQEPVAGFPTTADLTEEKAPAGSIIYAQGSSERMEVTGYDAPYYYTAAPITGPVYGAPLASGWYYKINVLRAQQGTTAAAIQELKSLFVVRVTYPVVGETKWNEIISSDNASGQPQEIGRMVGLPTFGAATSVLYSGADFIVDIYNSVPAMDRWLVDLVIRGRAFKFTDEPAVFELEQAIPNVVGSTRGVSLSIPFGASSVSLAKAYTAGVLRGGRMSTAWLTLTFRANVSDNTTSIMTAEIGQLVRYTGTGAWREKIDDWYRITSVDGVLDGDGQWYFTFVLAPAHLWFLPSKTWLTFFGWQYIYGSVGLGDSEVRPDGNAGLWTYDTADWDVIYPSGPVTAPNRATAPGVAAPKPGLLIVGADCKIAAGIELGASGHNSYPANTGGVGVMFRCNFANPPTQWWAAYFNATSNEVILANATDGVVARAAWTPTTARTPEIEVRAMATRIQVFVDAAAEPILTVTSTRFQTNTSVGPYMNRTITVTGTTWPGFNWFAAQRI